MNVNIGDKFEYLTVIGEVDPYRSPSGVVIKKFKCRCICGNECVVLKTNLTSGNTKSCGCKRVEENRRMFCKIVTWISEIDKFVTNLGFEKSDRFNYIKGNIAINLYDSEECSSLVPCRSHVQYSKDKKFRIFSDAKKDGIRLISIFQFEWEKNKEKLKSLIRDSLKYSVVYARKLVVRKVDKCDKKIFIDTYHLNGDASQGSVAYGLYDKDELISCMTFGKCRGQSSHHEEGSYELVRFATKSGVKVVGGASRLFKNFVKDYNPTYIVCYSDNDYYTGSTYEKLGFKLLDEGRSIDYVWIKGDEVLQRQACQPWKLRKKYPELVDLMKKSGYKGSEEDYFMLYLGFCKFYRCGNSRREWKQDSKMFDF